MRKPAREPGAPRRRAFGDRLCSLAIVVAGVTGNIVLWTMVARHFG
ncbi:hypothetical protein [Caldimonas sp. KR1-144]